jgi:2-haloacid dehalogenase
MTPHRNAPALEEAAVGSRPAVVVFDALDTCRVPAIDAMLVAVHPWDIHGAREAGLRTAWIDRTGGRYPRTMHRPDLHADSLTGLAELLGAARAHG